MLTIDDKIIGAPAYTAYEYVINSIDEIAAVYVGEYELPPLIQARATLSLHEKNLIEKAADIRNYQWFSFQQILLELVAKDNGSYERILDAVFYHQPHPNNKRRLTRKDIQRGSLAEIATQHSRNPMAIYSLVETQDGKKRHMPLLDMHIEKSERGLEIVKSVSSKILDGHFIIIETSRSYHMVGVKLINQKQFYQFLGTSLFCAPIVDGAYIAHQIIDGEAALRITSGKDRNEKLTVAYFK